MKKYLVIVAVALGVGCRDAGAQDLNPAEQSQNLQSIVSGSAVFRGVDNRYQGVKGTMTVLESYVPGRMKMANGTLLVHDKMNYDAYHDELIVVHRGNEVVVNSSMVRHFELQAGNGDTLKFSRLIGPDAKEAFFQILLTGGAVELIKKNSRKLIEAEYRGAYSVGRDYSEFVPEQKYFVSEKGKVLREFKNKKTFLALFPLQEDALLQFIKSEKIDFQNESHLVLLIAHLNQLIVN